MRSFSQAGSGSHHSPSWPRAVLLKGNCGCHTPTDLTSGQPQRTGTGVVRELEQSPGTCSAGEDRGSPPQLRWAALLELPLAWPQEAWTLHSVPQACSRTCQSGRKDPEHWEHPVSPCVPVSPDPTCSRRRRKLTRAGAGASTSGPGLSFAATHGPSFLPKRSVPWASDVEPAPALAGAPHHPAGRLLAQQEGAPCQGARSAGNKAPLSAAPAHPQPTVLLAWGGPMVAERAHRIGLPRGPACVAHAHMDGTARSPAWKHTDL